MKALSAAVFLLVFAGYTCAQPTPGSPSIPLSPVAAANVGSVGGGGITYQYGIEFVTIDTRVNGVANAPWAGDGTEGDNAVGRGSVDYAFRIGRYEVTSGQWAQFFAAAHQVFLQTGQRPPWTTAPGGIGGGGDPMLPRGGISWRTAAVYANWLHNDQAVTMAAFTNGAYDVSTFGYFGNIFTDQVTHHPDARFWIPTLDEWIAASHYDHNRNGPGQGGYWPYSTTSVTRPTGGPPQTRQGVVTYPAGQVNAGWMSSELFEFGIPLGAYGTAQGIMSPWGLLDTGGATMEWLEDFHEAFPGAARYRLTDGSYWGSSPSSLNGDSIMYFGGDFPHDDAFWHGLRIAASVPTPSSGALLVIVACGVFHRRRTGHPLS